MDQLDSIIAHAIEPYLQMIDQLQQKQKEKEAEIIVLKYAIVEMDRKFTELEKKVKPASTPAGRGTVGRTATTAGTKTGVSSRTTTAMNTPRGGSRAPATSTQDARQRSRTPVAGKMQSQLNSSMHSSKQSLVKPSTASSRTRVESKSRNQDLNSQSMRQGTSSTRNGKIEDVKKPIPQTTKHSNRPSMGFDNNKSRTSSRQGRDSSASVTSALKRGTQPSSKSGANNTSMSASKGRDLNSSLHQSMESQNLFQFGKVQSPIYPWSKQPQRDDPNEVPNVSLKLAYVPSYNGRVGRNNIEFVDKHHIAFFASTVGIIMNIGTYEQHLLTGHTDEIQCLTFNPTQKYLCTGQKQHPKEKDPYFIIWDSQNQEQIAAIAYHQKMISHVAFDESGTYLLTIGGQDKVTLAVWVVADLISQGKRSRKPVQAQPLCEVNIGKIVINTIYVDHGHSDQESINLVLGAERGVKFFTVKVNDKSIEEHKSNLGGGDNLKNIYGISFQGEDTVAAGDNGLLYIIKANKEADTKLKAENTPIQCLGKIERQGRSLLVTIAEEGKISLWEGEELLDALDLFDDDVKGKLGTENLKLTPKAYCFNEGVLIVGFEQNIILKYNIQTNQREILISGPSNSPQYIVPHPKLKVFASVGLDKYLRIYSYDSILEKKNCLINTIELQNQAKSCDFSPNGKYFAVGYENGVFEVFQIYDNEGEFFQLECLKLFDLNRKYAIQCVKFSPDGKYLIISCYKDLVVFSAMTEDFDQEGLLKGNAQTVTSLQFDKKAQYAMTNAIDGQVLCWELIPGAFSKVDPSKVKDIDWHRKCCVFSWDCIGAWSPDMKETDINCVSISNDKQLIAVADALGRAKVFHYPAYLPGQKGLVLEVGHTSNVISAQFMPDDSFLVTSGDQDCTIMIWSYKAYEYPLNGGNSPLNLQLGARSGQRDADINDDLERESMVKKPAIKKTLTTDEDENLLE